MLSTRGPRRARGFNLAELLVGLAVVGIIMTLGMPQLTGFINDRKVKNAAENILTGLQLARAEAIRRNTVVRFQLVSDMTAACTMTISGLSNLTSDTGPSWVVSLDDATGKCDQAPSETVAPRIIQKWSAKEGASGVKWNMIVLGPATANYIGFNGLGRLNPTIPNAGVSPNVARFQLDGNFATGGNDWLCSYSNATNGKLRCQRVTVTNAGQIRMCDPFITATSDPRYCAY